MRMWQVCKEAGRPFPTMDSDDVIDFQIIEAIAIKVAKEEEKAAKKAKAAEWKKDREGIDRLKELSGG